MSGGITEERKQNRSRETMQNSGVLIQIKTDECLTLSCKEKDAYPGLVICRLFRKKE